VRKYRGDPGTLVLATGDGKGYYKEQDTVPIFL